MSTYLINPTNEQEKIVKAFLEALFPSLKMMKLIYLRMY